MKLIFVFIISVLLLHIDTKRLLSSSQAGVEKVMASAELKARSESSLAKKIVSKMFALPEYEIQFELENKIVGSGIFTVMGLFKPQGDGNIGWIFKTPDEPQGELRKIMFPSVDDKWYIPFRTISSDVIYSNPWGKAKFLEFWITDDESKVHRLKIILPYSNQKYYINNEEANRIKGFVNKMRTETQNKIDEYKKSASVEAGNYIINKSIADSASSGEQVLQRTLTLMEQESQRSGESIKTDYMTYVEIYDEVVELETKLISKRNRLAMLNDKMGDEKNLNISKDNAVNDYSKKKAKDVMITVKADLAKSQKNLENALVNISINTPSASSLVEDSKVSVIDKLNLEDFTSNLVRVYSGN